MHCRCRFLKDISFLLFSDIYQLSKLSRDLSSDLSFRIEKGISVLKMCCILTMLGTILWTIFGTILGTIFGTIFFLRNQAPAPCSNRRRTRIKGMWSEPQRSWATFFVQICIVECNQIKCLIARVQWTTLAIWGRLLVRACFKQLDRGMVLDGPFIALFLIQPRPAFLIWAIRRKIVFLPSVQIC